MLDVLFPRLCIGCSRLGGYLCAECIHKISVREWQQCPMCGQRSVNGATHARCAKPLGMDGLVSVLAHKGLVKRMIGKLKYRLVTDMYETVMDVVVSLGEYEALEENNWVVVAVPLHERRQRWRGFNQAEELARRWADYFGWEWRAGVLERRVYTKPQVGFARAQRLENVKNAFGLRQRSEIRNLKQGGTDILLVDDVWTTGATMRECAKVLKRAGVGKVWGLTVAA